MKPPLGIMPKRLWEYQNNLKRHHELYLAVQRYLDVNMTIPVEWIEELNELIDYFRNYEIRLNNKI